jgi:hypothetical protein
MAIGTGPTHRDDGFQSKKGLSCGFGFTAPDGDSRRRVRVFPSSCQHLDGIEYVSRRATLRIW